MLGYVRDTQNYVQLAASGLTVFDLAPERVARDLAVVAVFFEGIVQFAQGIHRHAVDGFFRANDLLAVAGDKVEQAQIFVEFRQGEAVNLVVIEVVQFKVPEVAQQDVAGFFISFETGKVVLGLFVSPGQIPATAFVLNQQRAFPQQVDIAVFVTQLLDALLKGGDLAALDAKGLKKLVPEAFGVRLLSFDVLPVL